MDRLTLGFRTILRRFANGTSLRARLARATGWMLAGTLVQQVFGVFAAIAAARILGAPSFGELSVVRSTTVVFATLAGSGMSVATTRYVAALRNDNLERAGRVVGLLLATAFVISAAGAVVCAALATPIAARALRAPQLALPIALSAIAIILMIVSGVQLGVIVGCEAFRTASSLVAVEGVVGAVLMATGAWLGGVTGATIGFVSAGAILFVPKHRAMLRVCERAQIRVAWRDFREELAILPRFVIPAVLLGVAAQPAEWLSRVLLARGEDGLVEVGLSAAALSWAHLVLFVPGQIAGPAMPMLTSLWAKGDSVAFRKLLAEAAVVVVAVALAVALPLALASPWIMRAYGPGFARGAWPLAIAALAYAIGAVTMVLRAVLLSVGKAWLQNAYLVLWSVALLGAFLALRQHGASGLSWSYASAYAVLTTIQFGTIVRFMRSSR